MSGEYCTSPGPRRVNLSSRRLLLGMLLAIGLVGLAATETGWWGGSSAAVAGTFRATGPMVIPREYHTATHLMDGRVLIAGGGVGHQLVAQSELFDPSTGSAQITGALIATISLYLPAVEVRPSVP
jgi:hypothetical protein